MASTWTMVRAGALAWVTTAALLLPTAASAAPAEQEPPVTKGKGKSALNASPSAGLPGEALQLTGRLANGGKRAIVLQAKQGAKWTVALSGKANKRGNFSFATEVPAATTTFRVVARRVKTPAGVKKAVKSPARVVEAQTQSAALVLPATAALGAVVRATGSFTPARAGREVRIEQKSGAGWFEVGNTQQDASGGVALDVYADEVGAQSYRLVASPFAGAVEQASAAVSMTVLDSTTPPPPPVPGDTTAPGPVGSLSATAESTTEVSLSWTNPTDADFAGGVVRRAVGAVAPASPTSGSAVGTFSEYETTWFDTNLTPGTQYSYAVFTQDEVPNYSAGRSTTVTTIAPDTTAPGPVTGLTATDVTPTSVQLAWSNPGDGDLAGGVIRRSVGSTPPASPTAGTAVGDFQSYETSWPVEGLTGGTTFSFAVFTRDTAGNFSAGRSVTVTTPVPDTTPPSPVTGLEVTGRTPGSITLSWTNPTDADLQSLVVRYAVGATPPASAGDGISAGEISPASSSVGTYGLQAATQYSFAVFARDDVGNTSAGRSVTASTLAVDDYTPPGPVTDLVVVGRTPTSVLLEWTNPADPDAEGVVVRRALGATPPASPTEGDLAGAVDAPGTSLTDTSVTAGSTYSYAVFVRDAVPNYSPAAVVTTTVPTEVDTTAPGPVTGLVVSQTTVSSIGLTWVGPSDGDFEGVVVRRAPGGTPPASPTSGTLVARVSAPGVEVTDGGLSPTTRYSYAVFARDETPNYSAGATVTATTAGPTTADWAQQRHDGTHGTWSPGESLINSENVAEVDEEWSTKTGSPAIAGGLLYVATSDDLRRHGVLRATDLDTGDLAWQIATGSCVGGPVSVTDTLVVVTCGGAPRAYERSGDHGLVWDLADTDAGQSYGKHLVSGTTMVAWSGDRVAAYRLSDGQRLWQQLLPAGTGSVSDVATTGATVVVAYDTALRGLSAATGAQQWLKSDVSTNGLAVAGGWIYTNDDDGVARFAVSDGRAGWSVQPDGGVFQILGADGDTVYTWEAGYSDGSISGSVIHALRQSDGTERWQHDIQQRFNAMAVVGDLVWVTSSYTFREGRQGTLRALERATGEELRTVAFDDNIYGYDDVAFGAGKVVFNQGGSFGGSTPQRLRVWGLDSPRPEITTTVLPIGRLGTPYSQTLSATGGAAAWSLASGTLPAGLALSADGVVSGTPTAAATSRVVVRVSVGGRSSERTLLVEVVATSAGDWSGYLGGPDRNPVQVGTGALDLDQAATFGPRWTTEAPGPTSYGGDLDVAVDQDTMYTVAWDGKLRAYDTTGTQQGRTALWTAAPVEGGFTGRAVVAGNLVIVSDSGGRLHARRTSDGGEVWQTASLGVDAGSLLVAGSTVVFTTNYDSQVAVAVATGDELWNGVDTGLPKARSVISSDGSRAFFVSGCDLYAVDLADGTEQWRAPVAALDAADECRGDDASPAPSVVDGLVYAGDSLHRLVVRAATGAVVSRFDVSAYQGGNTVVSGGLWVMYNDEHLVAVDPLTGERVWQSAGSVPPSTQISSSGDVIFLVQQNGTVRGVSRVDGDTVWDGGTLAGYGGGTPVLTRNRILVADQYGVHAFGPL